MIDKREIFNKCLNEALNVIRLVTHETEEEQRIRFINDNEYHTVIKHIAHTYFEIKTNDCFQNEQQELYEQLRRFL